MSPTSPYAPPATMPKNEIAKKLAERAIIALFLFLFVTGGPPSWPFSSGFFAWALLDMSNPHVEIFWPHVAVGIAVGAVVTAAEVYAYRWLHRRGHV